jgi:hypothetical protein
MDYMPMHDHLTNRSRMSDTNSCYRPKTVRPNNTRMMLASFR